MVRDPADGALLPLEVATHGGSTSLANSTASAVVLPDGAPALLATHFLPWEGAAPGEAGVLLAVHRL